MIKVTVREKVYKDGIYKEEEKIKEHKDGVTANAHNGVLTIYNQEVRLSNEAEKILHAIAGYMPDNWLSWEKI